MQGHAQGKGNSCNQNRRGQLDHRQLSFPVFGAAQDIIGMSLIFCGINRSGDNYAEQHQKKNSQHLIIIGISAVARIKSKRHFYLCIHFFRLFPRLRIIPLFQFHQVFQVNRAVLIKMIQPIRVQGSNSRGHPCFRIRIYLRYSGKQWGDRKDFFHIYLRGQLVHIFFFIFPQHPNSSLRRGLQLCFRDFSGYSCLSLSFYPNRIKSCELLFPPILHDVPCFKSHRQPGHQYGYKKGRRKQNPGGPCLYNPF